MDLKEKIKNKKAKIGVIGLGYVGLPLVIQFARKGFKVYGFDIDENKVNFLRRGKSYIKHIISKEIKNIVESKRFFPTNEFSKLEIVDCIIMCVPTPLLGNTKKPDLSFVINTSKEISKYLRKGQLVILESTTYPGTTKEIVLPLLEKSGLKAGRDFFLAYSPEREDPGNKIFTTAKIPKVVGGIDKNSSDFASLLYGQIIKKIITVSSTEIAESTKMLENIFRAVNIALVNELKILFDKMGIDIWEVIKASKTKPFGFMPFYPGPGWGGHCIPIDPFYLSWKAKHYGFTANFIELAGKINTLMPHYVVSKVSNALKSDEKKLKDSKILILGMAYKKDIDDIRESPSLELIKILEKKGVPPSGISYNDPYIPSIPKMRHYNIKKSSIPLTKKNLEKFDCVIIATAHSIYDYKLIGENAKIIIDTRNSIGNIKCKGKLIKA